MRDVTQTGVGSSRWGEWRRRVVAAPHALGVAGAALGLIAVIESIARSVGSGVSPQLLIVVCLLALSTTVPMGLLRPTRAAVAVSLASGLSLALFQTLTVAGLVAQVVVLYRLGRDAPTRQGAQLPAWAASVGFLVLALAGPRPGASESGVLTVLLASLAPTAALAGMARRERSEARTQSAEREAIENTLVAHSARGERARIARELHDVVAHHISMVAVQAETARLTTPGMPVAGAQRLSAIGDTARSALTEMRRLLGILRDDTSGFAPERHPQPGLSQLNDLLDEAREASGSGTRLILSGLPVSLDPVVELAAYRIAQEALTNARRHAPGAAVDVELHYTDRALLVRIRDNGPGPSPLQLNGGHGLAGMQERAAAVGGEFRAGPATGGGFLVQATLPAVAEPPAAEGLLAEARP